MNRTIHPAPVRRSVTVKIPPERAFVVFAERMGAWWPRGKTIGPPHAAIIIEPRAGGRWYHTTDDGAEVEWGKVLDYAPPRRLLLGWQLNARFEYDPDFLTELEITFEPEPSGSTLVTLEHRNLERFGEAAEKTRASLDGGWPGFLRNFADFADGEDGGPQP